MALILVAEDDPMLLKTIELKLQRDGHIVITTKDGREAIEKIKSNTPDLIITDVMMPFFSGLEIIAWVKTNMPDKIPVILLSAMEQEHIIAEAFALGADDYITKPFNLKEFSLRVTKQLEKTNSGI